MKIPALLAAALLLASCAAPKSYYFLSADGPTPSGGGTGIGVGPVTLTETLDRPNLVLQDAPNRLAVAEDHRWAGDLSTSIARVTATNLGRRLGTGNVRTYPWQRDEEINWQITLDIREFHGTADGHVQLEAGWRAYSLPDRRLKTSRTFTATEPLESDGYSSLVAAQSRLLSRLAEDIAKVLR
jgi:uncharacterized lipoprotein YmbA